MKMESVQFFNRLHAKVPSLHHVKENKTLLKHRNMMTPKVPSLHHVKELIKLN
jgi:hypothetical protein